MAVHTGRVVTWDEALNSKHGFAPDLDKLVMDSLAPLRSGPEGKYPQPMPGSLGQLEY